MRRVVADRGDIDRVHGGVGEVRIIGDLEPIAENIRAIPPPRARGRIGPDDSLIRRRRQRYRIGHGRLVFAQALVRAEPDVSAVVHMDAIDGVARDRRVGCIVIRPRRSVKHRDSRAGADPNVAAMIDGDCAHVVADPGETRIRAIAVGG